MGQWIKMGLISLLCYLLWLVKNSVLVLAMKAIFKDISLLTFSARTLFWKLEIFSMFFCFNLNFQNDLNACTLRVRQWFWYHSKAKNTLSKSPQFMPLKMNWSGVMIKSLGFGILTCFGLINIRTSELKG